MASEHGGLLALIRADYRAWAARHRRSGPILLLGVLLDPSIRAVVLIRLCNASPWWANMFWRSLLIALHGIDCGRGSRIGPGLYLPHPHGITIAPGADIGADVEIYHQAGIGAGTRIGDGATLLPKCTVIGPITVGAGAVIGNGALVETDVPDGGVAYRARATVGGPPPGGQTAAERHRAARRIGHTRQAHD